MTRDDIIRMAREAGWTQYSLMTPLEIKRLERFAALIAAAERAAIIPLIYGHCDSDNAAQRTVDAIRARGKE